jgi:hypothetical protein
MVTEMNNSPPLFIVLAQSDATVHDDRTTAVGRVGDGQRAALSLQSLRLNTTPLVCTTLLY